MFRSAGWVHPMRSPRPWCFSHPKTAVTSRERNYLWMAVSHKCRPLMGDGTECSLVVRNQQPRGGGACHRQTCANQHNEPESKYKCLSNRFSDCGSGTCVETGRQLQAGEFDLVHADVVECAGRERQVDQLRIQASTKSVHHHDPKDGNRKNARDPGNCIVDSRSRANAVLVYRIHHDRSERSYGDRHPKPKNNDCEEERLPVASSN